jgi:hypothetical protein
MYINFHTKGVIVMSYYVNKIDRGNPFTSLKSAQDKTEDDSVQKSQKKKHIVCEREGSHYCTYMVDEKGQKILIKRIPVDDTDDKKNPKKHNEVTQINPSNYSIDSSARTAFECKQEMKRQAVHKENVQQIMGLLKEYAGIPGDKGKKYDY